MSHGAVEAMSKKPVLDGLECRRATDEAGTDAWIDNEVVGCEFEDVRHGKRLRQLLGQLSSKVGAATPWACQDWANTKAAYRFFGNERISEANILAGHFSSTRDPNDDNNALLNRVSTNFLDATGQTQRPRFQ